MKEKEKMASFVVRSFENIYKKADQDFQARDVGEWLTVSVSTWQKATRQ